jgi:hypothetical protein
MNGGDMQERDYRLMDKLDELARDSAILAAEVRILVKLTAALMVAAFGANGVQIASIVAPDMFPPAHTKPEK